ncbi:hypothetical protein AQUCO_00300070v1 [Aquilegia coerulea]|uniref:Factor of DNA methylation 1-5/IDN2 domain-containing protein n=1 Tax=Aquilegia coerulea TaxID=218851 RepID=A0A2G5EX56_AQUCA|nr:hypothetical protein AQUCO_00300070v1 [Aquilegia coerulea]
MGELNPKPFQDACMQKFPSNECDMKSAELCSLWQENMQNQDWFPFKRIHVNGKFEEVIDENDEKLMQLKDAWGEEVHKAVCVALLEINEYNPSTRSVISAIWNLKEDRKAHLKEVIAHLLKQLKLKKTKRRG